MLLAMMQKQVIISIPGGEEGSPKSGRPLTFTLGIAICDILDALQSVIQFMASRAPRMPIRCSGCNNAITVSRPFKFIQVNHSPLTFIFNAI
jgi:hypothetical protein